MFSNLFAIKANSLCYKYDSFFIFKDVSFTLKNGDILIIKGLNGSGKSTLLSLILGFQNPIKGEIQLICGENYITNNMYSSNNLSYINIYNTLDNHLSIKENLHFLSIYYGYFNFIKSNIFESNLQNIFNNQISILSTGQEKKANIAQIFLNYSPIWILDEPFVSLDTRYREILLNYIKLHRKLGGIVIITSHLDFYISNAKYILL